MNRLRNVKRNTLASRRTESIFLPDSKTRGSRVTMKFVSSISFMFEESPILTERYLLAKRAGFKGVESGFPIGFSLKEVADARRKAGIEQVLINQFTGDTAKWEMGCAAIPGREEEFEERLDLTIEYAKALDCKIIHIMTGIVESPTAINESTLESNLKIAVKKLQAEEIVGVIEPMNSITVPNYYLNNFEKGFKIVEKINSPYLKLMLDLYHVQLERGNITNIIKENISNIGFVQIAQAPDRHEPDTDGEIDYKYVLALLENEGYDGYVSLEYHPKAGSAEGLKWIKNFGYTL